MICLFLFILPLLQVPVEKQDADSPESKFNKCTVTRYLAYQLVRNSSPQQISVRTMASSSPSASSPCRGTRNSPRISWRSYSNCATSRVYLQMTSTRAARRGTVTTTTVSSWPRCSLSSCRSNKTYRYRSRSNRLYTDNTRTILCICSRKKLTNRPFKGHDIDTTRDLTLISDALRRNAGSH